MPTPTQPARARLYRRLWITLAALVILLLLLFIPPYVNVNRYQRRITTSISQSLGRPVHLDNVTLNLLPIPGFTLTNFVVSEDPAFGSEPTMRAETVHATLRVSSLWRRRVEFSTISLTEPSVNLVHNSAGAWNVNSILLQASHIEAAPTAQVSAGPQPRFPYIEATGARLNLKLDDTKVPFSLTEADFSLWLPDPQTWHFRITAHPLRTDVPVGSAGRLHLDGTLGRSTTVDQIPIDLHGEWKNAPLGEVSRILLGRDAGWRGDMTLTASALGTIGANELHTRVQVEDIHRANFAPVHLPSMVTECTANIANSFHAITSAHCAIPTGTGDAPFALAATIPDIRGTTPPSFEITVPPVPANGLAAILQLFSQRIPQSLALDGTISGSLAWKHEKSDAPALTGSIVLKNATVRANPDDKDPITLGEATLTPVTLLCGKPGKSAPCQTENLTLSPTTLALGGHDPAQLEGRFDQQGYTLHLTGSATPQRLAYLSQALPQFADGLQQALPTPAPTPDPTTATTPIHLDLTATRTWGAPQTWTTATTPTHAPPPRRHHR